VVGCPKRVTIRYAEGSKDELGFLPTHGKDEFEFRHRWLKYNVPRKKLYEMLELTGIEASKIPGVFAD
jgi:hypothetical protein